MTVANFTSVETQNGKVSSTLRLTPSSETGLLARALLDTSTVLSNSNKNNSRSSNKNVIDLETFFRNAPNIRKNQKLSSNSSHLEHLRALQSQRPGISEHPGITRDGQVAVRLRQTAANSSDHVKRHCENNSECGLWAECVLLPADQSKQCWCVNDLESPDPKTGGCGSRRNGNQQDTDNHGVLLHDNLKDIVYPDTTNVTYGGVTNEISPTLRLQSDGSSSDIPVLHIIAPVVGSFILIAILLVVSFIYRRRYLNKHFCVTRNRDIIVRNSDGTVLLDRMNNISKNPTYFSSGSIITRRHNVKEVASEHLKLLEVVGEGAFGQVFRGELYIPESESHKQVAVKVLKDGATREAREDFDREVEIMASFDHDNILKLLCVIVQETHGNPYMIFEYMEHGDLTELLRKNDPHFRNPSGRFIVLNKADLVDVSVQIANGMCYLAAQRFVHRDLATRNCLVGSCLIVKISDFGMSRDVYTTDYYRIGGSRMLPVRWMSPEAIKYGRFTSESDIWAYGVVLWEIFSYGKQPYCGHTNEEVVHFLDQGIILQRPDDCPSTVYHVMLGCWKRDPKERLVFDRLYKYLTEYRNRLIKPSHTQQQQQQLCSSGIDLPTVVQGSDTGSITGAEEKSAVDGCFSGVPDVSVFDGDKVLNYLSLGSNGVTCHDTSVVDTASTGETEKQASVTTIGEKLSIKKLLDGTLLMNNLSRDSNVVKCYEKQNEQIPGGNNVNSASVTCPTHDINHKTNTTTTNQSANSEPKKLLAKRMASYPLSIPKEKFSESQIGDDKQYSCGGRGSLKYHAKPFQNNKNNDLLPASALELNPELTPITQSTAIFARNSNRKSSRSTHTKCGSIHHKTNKVKDKSEFSEPNWKMKNQSAGITDSTVFGRLDECLDSRTAFMQSPRESSAVNEYSIPGKGAMLLVGVYSLCYY